VDFAFQTLRVQNVAMSDLAAVLWLISAYVAVLVVILEALT